jgi:hypothetical protein
MACSSSTWQPGGAANSRPTPHVYLTFGDRLIVASPCDGIRLPKPEPKRVEPLATEKVEALIEAMPARYRALVMLAAAPGRGLRGGGGGDRLPAPDAAGRPPTRAAARWGAVHRPTEDASFLQTVPLPQVVIDALAAHLAVFSAARVEILDATRKPDPKRRPAALVFTSLTAGRCGGPGSPTSGDPRRPQPGSATE